MTMEMLAKVRFLLHRLGLLGSMGLLLAIGPMAVSPQAAAAPAVDSQAIFRQAAPAVGVVRALAGTQQISGTAFVIDSQGWLLTAAHVARRAERLQVDLPGMPPLDARVVGYDATRDLAVLQVTAPSPLPALALAEGSPHVGDTVVVIGAPRGRPGVMTTGEVLATGTSLPGLARDIFLRFSAVVRPGESGGPLLNDRGQVAGVVVAASFDRFADRGGLAVSGEAIRVALPQLRQGAKVERAWIGVAGPDPARQDRQPQTGPDQGATVREIMPQSPATTAGLRPGDVVVDFDGTAIRTWTDLLSAVGQRRPGQSVYLVVLRQGTRVDVTLTLGVRP
jgi:serine protease Do